MGATDSHSPARRPPDERSTSAASLPRGSPSDGALAKSHKGSSRQLHKTHAVGHGRHAHTRVPSYGKGLHKLSKLGPGNTVEANGRTKTYPRSASRTPPTSPTAPDVKRSSSHVNLPKSGSKVAVKKNHSYVSLSRNTSTSKVGNQSKSEKAQTKTNLRKRGTDDAPLNGTASFEVGDDDQDDEWTEDSSSPYTTRHNSAAPSRPKTPLVRDPPSPDYSQDDPLTKSSANLPQSPPESPNPEQADLELRPGKKRSQPDGERKQSQYGPPDPQVVTNRLLSRNSKHYTPISETSNVSASITPVRPSSPSEYGGTTVAASKEQSMPVNGISRFLHVSGSGTDSMTPGSVTNLQSNLAHLNRDAHHNSYFNKRPYHPPAAALLQKPTSQNSKSEIGSESSSRFQSSAKLTRNRSSLSTPSPPVSPALAVESHTEKLGPSPFESARGANPAAGKSLTQLKLDLDRLASQRADAPRQPHNNPLMRNGYGGMLNTAGLWTGETDMAARVGQQWEIARKEVDGSKRFSPEVVRGSLVAKFKTQRAAEAAAERKKLEAQPAQPRAGSQRSGAGSHRSGEGSHKSVAGSNGSGEGSHRIGEVIHRNGEGGSLQGRGRIRFEVGSSSGRGSFEDVRREEENVRGTDRESIDNLLRRMWVSGEVGIGE